MKNLLIVFLLISQFAYSQDFKVIKQKKINIKGSEQNYFPKLSPDGSKIIFTKKNFNGLYLYDLKRKKIVQISDKQGAGYRPIFSEDGNEIFYRENDYEGMRKISAIYSYNIKINSKKLIEAKNRNVSVPQISEGKLFYSVGEKEKNKTGGNELWVQIEKQKIALYIKGVKKIISPNGKGNYIWVSLSPDKKRILYTFAGHGTYVSDLKGNVISEIGYLNAPVWYNNNWIVGMRDKDDTYKFISSDLFAVSSDGKKTVQLTATGDIIELYPSCSAVNSKIIYNSDSGEIYMLNIKN